MKTRHSAFAAAVSAAAMSIFPLSANATADELPACATTPWTAEVHLDYHGQWTYTYRVTWCVEDGTIRWVLPAVSYDEKDGACTWVGSMEEWTRRDDPATGGWTTFNMSEFSCVTKEGPDRHGVNPWAIVSVYPDGTHRVVGADIAEPAAG